MRRRTQIALACPTPLAGVLRDLGAAAVAPTTDAVQVTAPVRVFEALPLGGTTIVLDPGHQLGNRGVRGIRHWVR